MTTRPHHNPITDHRFKAMVVPLAIYLALQAVMLATGRTVAPDLPAFFYQGARIVLLFAVIVLLYLLTAELFTKKAAFFASIAFAVSPVCTTVTAAEMSVVISAVTAIASILLMLRYRASRRRWLLAAAAALAWTTLILNATGGILVAVIPLYLATGKRLDTGTRKKVVEILLWFGVAAFCSVLFFLGLRLLADGSISLRWMVPFHIVDGIQQVINGQFFSGYRDIYQFFKGLDGVAPFMDSSRSITSISRHYLPLVYLMGLAEAVAIAIWPLSIIPLCIAAKRLLRGPRLIVFIIQSGLVVYLYLCLIRNDTVGMDQLFLTVVLFSSWIGFGLALIADRFSETGFRASGRAVYLCLYILFPALVSLAMA